MRATKSKGKRTAFVPRIIFEAAAVASVVPLCVACRGGTVEQQTEITVARGCFADGSPPLCGVAQAMSDAGLEFTVAAMCFEDGSPSPCGVALAMSDADLQLTVAAMCFEDGSPCDAGSADASFGHEGGVAEASFSDVIVGVAVDAFVSDADKG
jgi:hypothetical protein